MVRTYQLYLIEDEFASHYFGRERMFFQLFKESSESTGDMKSLLTKQIEYITKPIPSLRLHQYINQKLQRRKDFRFESGVYYIENGRLGSAKLEIFDKFLLIEAVGTYESETLFFEVLRKHETSFLAIDLKHHRYGWLNPIKEKKLI